MKSVNNFVSRLRTFEDICGLKINSLKTEAISLGKHPLHKLPNNIKWNTNPVKVLGVYLSQNLDEAYSANISNKLKKIKQLLNSWKQRKLTLIGKVLIIKSLAVSQIIYLANLQPFPDESIKEFERLFYEFLWGGTTHKIKKSIIVQNYDSGGQKMIDLKLINQVQKLKWVRFYLNNHNCIWKKTMENLIKVNNLNLLLRGNIQVKNIPQTTKFYTEVLMALEYLNTIGNNNDISKQYVFYNRHLSINRNIMYDNSLFEAGAWRVEDLFNSNGHVIPFSEWKRRGVTDKSFLVWRGLVQKIKTIKATNRLTNENMDKLNDLSFSLKSGQIVDILNSKTRDIYDKLISQNICKLTNKAMNKYSTMYELKQEDWQEIYTTYRLCTNDNQIKELQYKILHRYIPTNKLLFQMGKVASNKCTFCELYDETIEHVFFHCHCIRDLWFHIEHKFQIAENLTISFSVADVLLGYGKHNESTLGNQNVHINTVLLYVKYHIWKCKISGIKPTKQSLMVDLKNHGMFVPYFKTFVR